MLDLLVLSIAPAIFIFLFIYAKDRYEPEPLHLVLWIFFLGGLSTIPAMLIEMPFPDSVVTSSVIAPIVEEMVKFLVVFLFMYRHAQFNEPVDGIVYAMTASLGFATIENIFYVIDGGLAVGIMRALLSVPGHVIFSCIWGAALGIAKFRPEEQRAGIIITGLFGAMLLHGIFNFSIAVLEVLGLLVLLILVPTGIWWTFRKIRFAHADPASACSAYSGMFVRGPAETIPEISPGICIDQDRSFGPTGEQMFCTDCGAALQNGISSCEQCGKKR